ncbi:MAG: TolC family protein [Thermoleophilia bacterium]|nr:TolC family protein [Thermoleophilia bacterium]
MRTRFARAAFSAALALAAAAALPACLGSDAYRQMGRELAAAPPPPREDGPDPFAGETFLRRDAVLREVLRRNPSIHAARSAWRAALARYPQARSLDDPRVAYGVAPLSFGSNDVNDAHQAELSQRLPFPGKLALRGEVMLAEAEAAEHELAAVRLRLATMAWLLYDELYLLDRALEVNAHHVALLEEFRELATRRYEAGEASQQDPLQAEVEHARLLQREVSLRADRRVVAEQLNVLLHRPSGTPLPPPPVVFDLPSPELDAAEREALLARALERPELRAAGARVRSREADVALARREFLPDVTVVGAYNGVMQERDLQPFVGLALEVPLQLRRRFARLDQAQADLARAERERAGVEDELRFEVEAALERLAEARDVLALHRDRLLPAARDQLEAARIGFVSGRNSFLALIEAENNLRDFELGLERARTDVSRRVAELQRAAGVLPSGE